MKIGTPLFGVVIAGLVAATVFADEPEKIGQVSFPVSCSAAVQRPFERAVALLHSFWYLEAIKAFGAVAQADPDCAMAYWGLAMSNWTQIWSPPPLAALRRGADAVDKAKAARPKTPREQDFVAAAEAFFTDADTLDHRTRAARYGKAMEQMAQRYPDDREVMAFYALSLQATADPHDKTYANQRRSGEIAEAIFALAPDHPGAAHYIIHAYDYPSLAAKGLPAARRYAQFAPSVPHALHMPSHIYVLLGMWPETIQANIAAAAAEKDRGNPDDRMHALDYLMYGYLQQAQDAQARRILEEARGITADLAARKYDSGRPTAHFAMAAIEAHGDQRGLVRLCAGVEQIAEIGGVERHGTTTILPNTARSSSRLIASRPSLSGSTRSITGTSLRVPASAKSASRSLRAQLFEPMIRSSKVQM